jgi:hypothetical protein
MSAIRVLGLIVGALTFLYFFGRFRRGRARRFDFFWIASFSLSLIAVSLFPNLVNVLRDMLMLEQAQFSRLIAVLVVSNVLLWLLISYSRMRASDYTDQFDRLVRELGAAEFRRSHPEAIPLPSVVVVIPAYQEADNIGVVLEAMPRSVCGRQLATVVIDDGSQDETLEMARKAGALALRSPVNRGGGAALRMGFDIARAHGAEIVVTMDADGQHLPSEIERLVEPITDGNMDFVIGSRILGRREKDSLVRYLGIHVFNAVIRLLTAVKITDCSNGFRAFRVSELSRVQLRQDQFHASELIIDAAKKGIRIGEAPVTVKRRLSGKSKKGRNWRYGLAFARTILKTWWR